MNAPSLTGPERDASAQELLDARSSRRTLSALPHPPPSDSDAYAIQERVVSGTNRPIAGWKIGATSEFAQQFLGCDGPFSGPIFAGDVYDSGATIPTEALLNPMMEPEIAVVLGSDLGADGPVTAELARAAVSDVRPSIELVGGCFPDIASCGYRSVIADCGANLGIVLGPLVVGWSDIDLAAVPVVLLKNGDKAGAGVGADALGGAMHALAWLANHLRERGITLQAGDIVTTGTIGGVAPISPGDVGTATHGPLGGVDFRYA